MREPLADLLIVNGRPWSDGAPVPGADGIAIGSGRILAVGGTRALEALAGPRTRRVDARGATVTPGITDAHLHLLHWARAQAQIALAGAATRAEALARVRRALDGRPGATAAIGRGWDANLWNEPPERGVLDAVSGERPVLLHSHDFHALWVNSAALRAAGVSRDTPDPRGGRIERDAAGEPTGVVREHAVRRFAALEAGVAGTADAELLPQAVGRLHAFGITAVHDFEGAEALRALRAVARAGAAPLRVLMHLPHAQLDAALALGLESGIGDDVFRIGAVKLFADGTLGSRTAAVLEPYDGTTERGMELIPPAELRATVERALAGGLAVAIHAIGDRAVRSALDAFEAAGALAARPALPSRIEHVQLLDPADRPRFANLGVAASLQPLHCTADLDLVERHWHTRRERAYPWRTLFAAGARLAFGSDAPVESPSVAAGLHAAVTRQRADGRPGGGFLPAERLTLDEALGAYTEGGARLAGSWPRLGRLAAGLEADLVVWDADLHALPAGSLHEAAPMMTLVAGDVAYESAARSGAAAGAGVAVAMGRGRR
ncbi:MAG: hypothetical protein A2W00_12330 [Candidatus Eisenbacteria bacterium RBG_16_71_46]|nr:MAG: hypothetical protein A2W00_12330 [Candidatus Eisenbacteria bacterium RBG_16_71_46]